MFEKLLLQIKIRKTVLCVSQSVKYSLNSTWALWFIAAYLSSCTVPADKRVLNYAISDTFMYCFTWCSRTKVVSHHSSSVFMNVAITINTSKWLSLYFQPRSNKAEKFDYVSSVTQIFFSVKTLNIKHDYLRGTRCCRTHKMYSLFL